MKVQERILDVTSTLDGERVGMTIDQGALAHIMSVLTDLYSDPELAIIREYSTNALDAHVEAGNTQPIEVTLPSPLSPFFRVRDYGVGLTVEDIREIYSRYGTSTKRQSNDVVGMLGLGCKSALTYTDQFTLVSVKGERKVTVSVSRDANGAGSMTIVSDERSSEPNGTEVIIPTKRGGGMEDKAEDFFQYWQPGTVLVNGEEPKRLEGMWINDRICLSQDVVEPKIVMGNVAYPAPGLDMRDRLGWHSNVVAFVDIGTVAFAPSREALRDSKETQEQVARVKREVIEQMDASFKAQIEAAESPPEMLKLYLEARSHGYGGGRHGSVPPHEEPAWEDDAGIKHRVPMQDFGRIQGDQERFLAVPFAKTYRRRDGEWYPSLPLATVKDGIFFEGFDAAGFSPSKREKLEVYKTDNELPQAQFVFVDKLANGERMWLRPEQIHKWADVDAIKIERTKDGVTKPRGAYKGKLPDKNWHHVIMADEIDTTKPLYWHHGSIYDTQGHISVRFQVVEEDATIVALSANRIPKFTRDFPNAKALNDLWTEHLTKVFKGFAPEDIIRLRMERSTRSVLQSLDPARVDDPDICRWIYIAKRKVDQTKQGTWERYSRYTAPPECPEDDPLNKYPLAASSGYYSASDVEVEHIILYLNAAYAAERG